MDPFQTFDTGLLDNAGLNRQAVFNIEDIPKELSVPESQSDRPYRQLILIGHAGTKLWERVKQSGIDSENPIDDFTIQTVERWFSSILPGNEYRIIYPGNQAIGLQRLGELAGWHNPSPFMVGIDREWGTWFAYRAVVLADTRFAPTRRIESQSPCTACKDRVCVSSCPGGALSGGFNPGKCVAYRKEAGSGCRETCLARLSCPVGSAHRYSDEQIRHSYSRSLQVIEKYC